MPIPRLDTLQHFFGQRLARLFRNDENPLSLRVCRTAAIQFSYVLIYASLLQSVGAAPLAFPDVLPIQINDNGDVKVTNPVSPSAETAESSTSNAATAAAVEAATDFTQGTQDLGALIGLFATDAVETYAVDHGNGYVCCALSAASMLGLLGYFRSMFKLAMGKRACTQTAFDIASIRSAVGASSEEKLPADELTEVLFLRRDTVKEGQEVEWSFYERQKHTEESMPLVKGRREMCSKDFTITAIDLQGLPPYFFVVLAQFLCCLAVSFPIVAFLEDGLSLLIFRADKLWPPDWSDSRAWIFLFAVYGLFLATFISSVLWFWIYAQSHLPSSSRLWKFNLPRLLKKNGRRPENEFDLSYRVEVPNSHKTVKLAFFRAEGTHFVYPGKVPHGKSATAVRVVSGLAGAAGIVGYLMQYILLKNSKLTYTWGWLVCHTAIAGLRIIFWALNPKFDDFKVAPKCPRAGAKNIEPVPIKHSEHVSELELVLTSRSLECGRPLSIPIGILHGLESTTLKEILTDTFHFLTNGYPSFLFAYNQKEFFDFKPGDFARWLEYRGVEIPDGEKVSKNALGARIYRTQSKPVLVPTLNMDGKVVLGGIGMNTGLSKPEIWAVCRIEHGGEAAREGMPGEMQESLLEDVEKADSFAVTITPLPFPLFDKATTTTPTNTTISSQSFPSQRPKLNITPQTPLAFIIPGESIPADEFPKWRCLGENIFYKDQEGLLQYSDAIAANMVNGGSSGASGSGSGDTSEKPDHGSDELNEYLKEGFEMLVLALKWLYEVLEGIPPVEEVGTQNLGSKFVEEVQK